MIAMFVSFSFVIIMMFCGGPAIKAEDLVAPLAQSAAAINATFVILGANDRLIRLSYNVSNRKLSKLVRNQDLDAQLATFFFIHGYLNCYNSSRIWVEPTYASIHNHYASGANVIFIDWEQGAKSKEYVDAAANVRIVAQVVSKFIIKLINKHHFDPQRIRLIGFSLGAQVAGFTGKELIKQGHEINWITGLDPALQLFNDPGSSSSDHIFKSDATFVDIIHTFSGNELTGFSTSDAIGCVDFYPNGGNEQPGCPINKLGILGTLLVKGGSCPHARAPRLFGHDYDASHDAFNCRMLAYNCADYETFLKGFCADCAISGVDCRLMGVQYYVDGPEFESSSDDATCGGDLKYFIKTQDEPYCCECSLVAYFSSLNCFHF